MENKKLDATSYSIIDRMKKIDLIFIANDARTLTLGNLPITLDPDEEAIDNDQLSPEKLIDFRNISELRNLHSAYSLTNLETAIRTYEFDYELTTNQKKILRRFNYDKAHYSLDLKEDDFRKLMIKISEFSFSWWAGYGKNQPHKNYGELHGLAMVDDDYIEITKALTFSEYKGMIKNPDTNRFCIPTYVFKHAPKNYKLKYSDEILQKEILIYVKLILGYEGYYDICVISFHDPE